MDKKGRLAAVLVERWGGQALDGHLIPTIASCIRRRLALPLSATPAIVGTLMHNHGDTLTTEIAEALSERLVLGRDILAEGKLLQELSFEPGFYLMEIKDAHLMTGKWPNVLLSFKIMEGALSGQIRTLRCSPSKIQQLGDLAGLRNRVWRRYHPRELVGVSLVGELTRVKSGEIEVRRFRVTEALRHKNARLKQERKKADCKVVCHYCQKTSSECALATHSKPWKLAECPKGHTAFFEEGECLVCQEELFKSAAGIIEFGEEDVL